MKSATWMLAALAATFALPAAADQNSWWGGEVVAVQREGAGNGFGYGVYEISVKAGTGVGSITGAFPICYANTTFSDCGAKYYDEKRPEGHLEVDITEFTPLGNNPQNRRWIRECLSNDDCPESHPNPPPRVGDNLLKAVSFNTFPFDNQGYAFINFNPYKEFHEYSVVVLPNKITWKIDGKAVLSRVPSGTSLRYLNPGYQRFDRIMRGGQMALTLNYWDGTQGSRGGFSGPPYTNVTSGDSPEFTRIAYYPATCANDDCDIAKKPVFLSDFEKGQFIRDGKKVKIDARSKICGNPADNDVLWDKIYRNAFPVYVSPKLVDCDFKKGISMRMTRLQP